MANIGPTPDPKDQQPVESRRDTLATPDPSEPVAPDGDEGLSPELSELGEFASESARPSPLDEIAEAERERLPRD